MTIALTCIAIITATIAAVWLIITVGFARLASTDCTDHKEP